MSDLLITFACGHQLEQSIMDDSRPRCACGETRVQTIKTPRPPRFRGACSGPYAETQALDAIPINLAPGGPLQLTTPDKKES